MSALFENFSHVSGNNPAKFHAFYKKHTISLFFAPYLSTSRNRRVDMLLISVQSIFGDILRLDISASHYS